MLLLAFAIVGPLLAFTGLILLRYADAERSRIQQDARDTVNSISVAIDRELVGLQYTLLALANAPSLRQGDLRSFQQFASEVARARNATIVLRDTQSRQVMNSTTPYGNPLPGATTLQGSDVEAAQTGRTVISDYFVGLQVQRPSFAVVTPIMFDDQLRYFLSLSVGTSVLDELIKEQNLSTMATSSPFSTAVRPSWRAPLPRRASSARRPSSRTIRSSAIAGSSKARTGRA